MLVLTVVAGLLALGAALAYREAGGGLLLGAFVGFLVVARVPTARAAVRPLAALGRAAMPLGLPLLVFAGAGVVNAPVGVQLVAGLVMLLVAWHWLVAPEWDASDNPLRKPGGGSLRLSVLRVSQVAAPIVLVGLALGYLLIPALDVLERSLAISTVLFLVAALLFAAALALRLVGFARTRLRALGMLFIAIALVRLAMLGGLLPGHDTFEWLPAGTAVVVAGVAFGLVVAGEVLVVHLVAAGNPTRLASALEAPLVARSVTTRSSAYGLLASVSAAVALLISVVAATTAGGAKEQLDQVTLQPIRPGTPTTAPEAVADDLALARTYSPVLVFTEDQLWSPTKVDAYLEAATMRDWRGTERPAPRAAELPADCPGIVPTPCYRLTISCESAADDCAMGRDATVGEQRRDEAVYVRVERRSEWRSGVLDEAGSPNPFNAVGPYARQTRVILQYWYFYPYDEWTAPVLGGQFKQRHEADWEAITIGLGERGPLWVGYSEHCGGTWSHWRDVRVAGSDPARLRPLVAVAEGSQAFYRLAEERRAPDWGKCAGVPADTLTLVSYGANIRDRTDAKWSWTPAEHLLVTAATPPMSFVGTWAPYSRTTLENFRKGQRLGGDQAGPATPTLQRLWREPVRTIFGGRHWRHE